MRRNWLFYVAAVRALAAIFALAFTYGQSLMSTPPPAVEPRSVSTVGTAPEVYRCETPAVTYWSESC